MWKISLIFLIVLLKCKNYVAVDFNAAEICSLIANGAKIKDPSACNKWYECDNLQPIAHVCSDGLFYSLETGNCVNSSSVTCISTNPCASLPDESGFIGDPTSCTHYYYCVNGQGTRGTCLNGGNYNPATDSCVLDFPCSISLLPDSYCNIIPSDVFIQNTTDCHSYQVCWKQKLYSGTCQNLSYFNAFSGVCLKSIPGSECPKTYINNNNDCQTNGQFISDNKTCNGYYYCMETTPGHFILYLGHCPTERFFSAKNGGVCVPRTNIVCPYDRCAGLGYTQIQLSNLSDDNCRGFGICQNGAQFASALCPTDQYFNEITQSCSSTVVTYTACVTTSNTKKNELATPPAN